MSVSLFILNDLVWLLMFYLHGNKCYVMVLVCCNMAFFLLLEDEKVYYEYTYRFIDYVAGVTGVTL